MIEIPLFGWKSDGRVALVDDEDAALVLPYRWRVDEREYDGGRPSGPYARRHYRVDGRQVSTLMHKLITGWAQTDHINHDGLDNQRANLRPATTAQNNHNQRPQMNHSSQYKGVTWHRKNQTWQAVIKAGGKHRYLGCFAEEIDAATAYDSAALEAFGAYAYLNFPGRAS